MSLENNYISDIEEILSHRYDNGGDYWATLDKRLLKGAPFTTVESPLYLLELGVSADDPVMKETANLIFSTWKEDGRFKIFPTGSIYPCQTAESARTLCYMGHANDSRIEKTFQYLLKKRCLVICGSTAIIVTWIYSITHIFCCLHKQMEHTSCMLHLLM